MDRSEKHPVHVLSKPMVAPGLSLVKTFAKTRRRLLPGRITWVLDYLVGPLVSWLRHLHYLYYKRPSHCHSLISCPAIRSRSFKRKPVLVDRSACGLPLLRGRRVRCSTVAAMSRGEGRREREGGREGGREGERERERE